MDKEIEKIRARHEATKQALDNERYYSGTVKCMSDYHGNQAHTDRATLLRLLDAARAELAEERAKVAELIEALNMCLPEATKGTREYVTAHILASRAIAVATAAALAKETP